MEFGAVIEGERLEPATVAADRAGRGARYLLGVARGKLLDDGVSGFPLDQREHAMAQVAAHHRIALPVADAPACFDLCGTIANGPLAGQHAPGIVAAVALAPEFAHDPGMAPQVTTGSFIPANAPVDRLVADAQRAPFLEHTRDLFGAPFAAYQSRHPRQILGAEVRPAATSSAPGNGVAMRLLGAIIAVVVRHVAAQFPPDRAAMATQRARNLRCRTAAHPLRGDQVSFFLGELVIRHGCNPFPGRMRRQPVSPAPHLLQRKLHLLCESALCKGKSDRTERRD